MQNLKSAFGAFLDPVADKLMVTAVLLLLCTQPVVAGPLEGNSWLIPICSLGACGVIHRGRPRARRAQCVSLGTVQ